MMNLYMYENFLYIFKMKKKWYCKNIKSMLKQFKLKLLNYWN